MARLSQPYPVPCLALLQFPNSDLPLCLGTDPTCESGRAKLGDVSRGAGAEVSTPRLTRSQGRAFATWRYPHLPCAKQDALDLDEGSCHCQLSIWTVLNNSLQSEYSTIFYNILQYNILQHSAINPFSEQFRKQNQPLAVDTLQPLLILAWIQCAWLRWSPACGSHRPYIHS